MTTTRGQKRLYEVLANEEEFNENVVEQSNENGDSTGNILNRTVFIDSKCFEIMNFA